MLMAILLVLAQPPDFEKQIAPILVRRCLECHAGDEPAGKLNLTTGAGLRLGGRGGDALLAMEGQQCLLLDRVFAGTMPPPAKGKPKPLPPAEKKLLADWVKAGAPWPKGRVLDTYELSSETRGGRDLWSLQPLGKTELPDGVHPVDHFVEARLRRQGWKLAPQADKATLLRRLSIDLVGLPPTFAEVQAFELDSSVGSYERVVERLLASPRYGERWARHWLDVARWAETSGYERDQEKPFAWKYRDWVIDAFNRDLDYRTFVIHQLAGDEVANASEPSRVATGFLRLGTWNDEPNDAKEYQYDRLEDMVHATSTAFLALTVKCARCHDHKFDPIPQIDYYKMGAAFWGGPVRAGSPGSLGGPPNDLLGKDILGWTDLGANPPPLNLLKKGDPARQGAEVPFGYLSVVSTIPTPGPKVPLGKTTGRRLAMAEWIANPANPLTYRVWVNRVWMHHFGEGLVRSVDNFGYNGDKPTHPELLDYLATRFIEEGYSTKSLHRLLVTSTTYKQSTSHPQAALYENSDAGNHLLWRGTRRRLDAETVRDAMLLASGQLDLGKVGGPSFIPEISPEALEGWSRKGSEYKPSPPDQQRRRTLYAFVKRGLLDPTQTVFDAPDSTMPCGRRDSTTVPTQALALLNNPMAQKLAEALAMKAGGADENERFVAQAWRMVLARDPRREEQRAAQEHLLIQTAALGSAALARRSLALVLMNTNEFVFVD
jgi:hypothetical protein